MPATLARSGGVILREALAKGWIEGPRDLRVASCSSNAHLCRDGDLFVALVNEDGDGHDDAIDAVSRGALAVLAERPLPLRVPVALVEDTRVAYAQLCHALVDRPTEQMRTIGVSGTHGKTVTARLMAAVLRAAGHRVGTINSLENSDGIVACECPRSSAPPEIAQHLAEMVACGCTHAVLELDSRDLARRRAAGLELDVAVLTNVRRAHLDFHQNVANYRRAQLRLLDQLHPGGVAIVNADDGATQQLLPELPCPTLTFAQHDEAPISATIVERCSSEQTFLLTAGDDVIPVRTRMVGEHHVDNCLAVAAAALAMEIDLPTIARGLETVASVPRRMEAIDCGQSFGVIADVADTPDRLSIALKALRRITAGRVICVADADVNGPPELRPLLGRVLERNAMAGIIAAGEGNAAEQSLPAIHDVLDGYDRPAKAHVIPDREQAIRWALAQAAPGDAVLIAGCRDHTRRDDRDLIRDWLYQETPSLHIA